MRYDRQLLVETLVAHQRFDIGGCVCGWGELGKSHAEHIATMYEQRVTEDPSHTHEGIRIDRAIKPRGAR